MYALMGYISLNVIVICNIRIGVTFTAFSEMIRAYGKLIDYLAYTSIAKFRQVYYFYISGWG